MSETPERISISPTYNQKLDDDYYLVDRKAFPGKGTEYIRADHVDALLKAEREKALREAAAIAPKSIRNYGMMKPGKPDQFASREAQIVAKGFARLIEEDILALISEDATDG